MIKKSTDNGHIVKTLYGKDKKSPVGCFLYFCEKKYMLEKNLGINRIEMGKKKDNYCKNIFCHDNYKK